MRPLTLALLGLLAACTGDEPALDSDTDLDTQAPDPTCDPPGPTSCDNPHASIRGEVRLADDAPEGSRQGRLYVALMHEWLGQGAAGGVPHTGVDLGQVDLTQGPVPFELDMCTGGIMWSEENCSYQLVAVVDTNGNQTATNIAPDPGELSGRVQDLSISCSQETDCLEVVVDCAGPDCVAFDDPTTACACAPESCGSEFVTCQ